MYRVCNLGVMLKMLVAVTAALYLSACDNSPRGEDGVDGHYLHAGQGCRSPDRGIGGHGAGAESETDWTTGAVRDGEWALHRTCRG